MSDTQQECMTKNTTDNLSQTKRGGQQWTKGQCIWNAT